MTCTQSDTAQMGQRNYHDGLAAEDAVARRYRDAGYHIVAKRWRGKAGEIDLICEANGEFAFVEVKKSKTHAAAIERLTPRQLARIAQSAEAYIGAHADPFSNFRLDLATVDGTGDIAILENLRL